MSDTVPTPDASNPQHADFVRDWIGNFTDLDLAGGCRSVELYSGADVGDFIRTRMLCLVDRVEAEQEATFAAVARAVLEFENSRFDHKRGDIPSPSPNDYARALLSQFNITPKVTS